MVYYRPNMERKEVEKMKKPNYNQVTENYKKIVSRAWMKRQGIKFLDELIK